MSDGLDPNAEVYARDVIARMNPRDPAEEMLVSQLLFAHARVMRLTQLANNQTDIDAMRVTHEYADRASNTYRQLMLALAEYRQPPRTGDSFTVVKQANVAGQQVVQNNEKTNQTTTNEQGFDNHARPPKPMPALPARAGQQLPSAEKNVTDPLPMLPWSRCAIAGTSDRSFVAGQCTRLAAWVD